MKKLKIIAFPFKMECSEVKKVIIHENIAENPNKKNELFFCFVFNLANYFFLRTLR